MSEEENTEQEQMEQESSNLPTVFQMDLSQREEFLSQVGSFTQEQRRIFHRICDFYDPMLDYNRFVLHAGKDILFANNQIEILLKKIRNAHYGLLKFKNDQGELKPDRIIITNRDSRDFYKHLIEDEIQRLMLDDSRGFISLEEMEKLNFRIPFDLVETQYPDVLSPQYIQKLKESDKIYTMPLKSGGAMLFTSHSMEFIVEICYVRIKNALKNPTFISTVSRYMDLKISDIQKKQFSRDKGFWKKLSAEIIRNKDDILLRIKHIKSFSYAVFRDPSVLSG